MRAKSFNLTDKISYITFSHHDVVVTTGIKLVLTLVRLLYVVLRSTLKVVEHCAMYLNLGSLFHHLMHSLEKYFEYRVNRQCL